MKVSVELGNEEVRRMLVDRLVNLMPDIEVDPNKILIQVKSKQNYRLHEWEAGEIRVTYQEEQ